MSMTQNLLEHEVDKVVLYDTKNSYYAGIVRNALCEKNIDFVSHYVDLQAMEQLQPWFIRMNPAGQVPSLKDRSGAIVNDSRNIVNWSYGSPESAAETEVFEQLYKEDPGSLAWLYGEKTIPVLKVMVKSPLMSMILPKKIRGLAAENPDLQEIYDKKLEAMSKKHFTKSLADVQQTIERVLEWLDQKRIASGGQWILGPEYGRVDVVTSAYVQWVARVNEYAKPHVQIPVGMLDYLERAQARPGFQKAIGQYGKDAFVLTLISQNNRKAGCALLVLLVLIGSLITWLVMK